MKSLLILLTTTILLVLAGLSLLYVFQERLLYPAPKYPVLKVLPENAIKVDLNPSYAYLLKPKIDANQQVPLVIFTHGNGELIDMWVDDFDYLITRGVAVLLVEYPGYGKAKGEPNLQSISNAVINAYDTVTALPFIDQSKIVAYGRSIGGGPATILAQKRKLAALGLESTFSDLATLVKEKSMPSFLLKDKYNNVAIVENLSIPVFIYHGENDALIPFSHAQKLKLAAQDALLISYQCGHNNCPRQWGKLLNFLEEKAFQ